jgi:hypothetical protein
MKRTTHEQLQIEENIEKLRDNLIELEGYSISPEVYKQIFKMLADVRDLQTMIFKKLDS